MIYDHIDNWQTYKGLSDGIAKAFEYLVNTDFTNMENGKYEIDGKSVVANVSTYDTKLMENAKLECHQKYLDIQFIVSGSELIRVGETRKMIPTTDYDEVKDIQFLKGEGQLIKVEKGYFAVFFPNDAHAPNISIDETPAFVKKVVMKVLCDC